MPRMKSVKNEEVLDPVEGSPKKEVTLGPDWKEAMGLKDPDHIGSTIYMQINDLEPDMERPMQKTGTG